MHVGSDAKKALAPLAQAAPVEGLASMPSYAPTKFAIPSLRPSHFAPVDVSAITLEAGDAIPDASTIERLLTAVEPLLLAFTLAGFQPRSAIFELTGSAAGLQPSEVGVHLGQWWVRQPNHLGFRDDRNPTNDRALVRPCESSMIFTIFR